MRELLRAVVVLEEGVHHRLGDLARSLPVQAFDARWTVCRARHERVDAPKLQSRVTKQNHEVLGLVGVAFDFVADLFAQTVVHAAGENHLRESVDDRLLVALARERLGEWIARFTDWNEWEGRFRGRTSGWTWQCARVDFRRGFIRPQLGQTDERERRRGERLVRVRLIEKVGRRRAERRDNDRTLKKRTRRKVNSADRTSLAVEGVTGFVSSFMFAARHDQTTAAS